MGIGLCPLVIYNMTGKSMVGRQSAKLSLVSSILTPVSLALFLELYSSTSVLFLV